MLPSTVVIPATAGISLLLTKRRRQKRDPSFRWDDGGGPTVRCPLPIAIQETDPRSICATAGCPVSDENADRAKSTNSGGRTLILPWQGRWLAEGQTEGCPARIFERRMSTKVGHSFSLEGEGYEALPRSG